MHFPFPIWSVISAGMRTDQPLRFQTDPSAYSILLITTLPSWDFLSALITFTGATGLSSSNVLLSFGFAFIVQTYCLKSYSAVSADGWYSQTILLIVFGPAFFTSSRRK